MIDNVYLNFCRCRRKDSQVKAEVQVLKTDFSQVAKANDIIINPGANVIVLEAKVCFASINLYVPMESTHWILSETLVSCTDVVGGNISLMPSFCWSKEF